MGAHGPAQFTQVKLGDLMNRVRQDRSVFIFSIDAECLWVPLSDPHYRDLLPVDEEMNRRAILALLRLVEKNDITATWAVVGQPIMGECDPQRCDHWKQADGHNCSSSIPGNPCYGAHRGSLRMGIDLVNTILSCRVPQEIGYHSFSHMPFTRISRRMAEDELKKTRGLEKEWGTRLRSFVFPENKVGHVDLLKKYGFDIYRGETMRRYRKEHGTIKRTVYGAIDKIIAPPVYPIRHDGIWELRGSMDFCDPQVPNRAIPAARLGMFRAEHSNQTFHIYVHPWNLLLLNRLEKDLDRFLGHIHKKALNGKVEVMSMGEYATHLGGA